MTEKLAGRLESKERRATGTVVSVYDAEKAGVDVDGKYAVVCEDHGNMVSARTREESKYTAAAADEWCPTCRGDAPEHRRSDNGDKPPREERDRARVKTAIATLSMVKGDMERALRALKRNNDTEIAEREIRRTLERIKDASFEISG